MPHQHAEEEWQPADGWQRNAFTALATVLTGIGFSAILFGLLYLTGRRIDARTGVLWGLAGFVCFSLAPSLGLPPEPPGVAVADVFDRQLWWAATVVATAMGLYLIAARSGWLLKLTGIVCLVLPHAVGAGGRRRNAGSGSTRAPVHDCFPGGDGVVLAGAGRDRRIHRGPRSQPAAFRTATVRKAGGRRCLPYLI